jgi:hypothetical protein
MTSHLPLVATNLNWCKEQCVAKASQNYKHKAQLMNQYTILLIYQWDGPPTCLVMV